MDVDIHRGWIDFDEQTAHRVPTFHERGVIAFEKSEVQAPIFYWAPIHEQVLVLAGGARDAGRTDEAPDAKGGMAADRRRRSGRRRTRAHGKRFPSACGRTLWRGRRVWF